MRKEQEKIEKDRAAHEEEKPVFNVVISFDVQNVIKLPRAYISIFLYNGEACQTSRLSINVFNYLELINMIDWSIIIICC
jgi:hypothetical protein